MCPYMLVFFLFQELRIWCIMMQHKLKIYVVNVYSHWAAPKRLWKIYTQTNFFVSVKDFSNLQPFALLVWLLDSFWIKCETRLLRRVSRGQ